MEDTRYPYTYACDYVRQHCADFDEVAGCSTPSISRSQAAKVMAAFETIFGMTHEAMAMRLADQWLKETQ